jgi:cytidine deaminase
MKESSIQILFQTYPDSTMLNRDDADLLEAARKATGDAYAPYSNFRVGAAVRLINGKILSGSNQENASFPVGICAERVVLSAASATYPGVAIVSMAVTYVNETDDANKPISPCGICRQTLAEYQLRFNQPISMILGGKTGEIYIINRATDLLPFAFSRLDLKSL